jgi:DNA-damage-inducible protein J
MAANALIHARVDHDIKDKAASVLKELGLTVSDVIRITLTRVANDQALPFELKVPNAETRAAMLEARDMMKAGKVRFETAEELFDALGQEKR